IIDESLAERTYGQIRLQGLLQEAYANLPESNRLHVSNSLGNALIHVAFQPESSFRIRKESIPLVFDLLYQLSSSFSGEIRVEAKSSPLGRPVRKIAIRRGSFVGPCFDGES